jgi:multidrug efflux pump subunit AcrA (membrane-fusion protein)
MGGFAGAADEPAAKPTPAAAKPAESPAKAAEPVAKQAEGSPKSAEPAGKPGETPAKSAEPSSKSGDAAAKAGEKCKDSAPATHTVKRGPLKITITLDGVFEAQTAREIFVKPEEWTMLTVEEAAQHGQHVRKGDVLLTLDTEKLDRTIDDLRADQKLSDLSIQQNEDQLKAFEKTMPMDLEASKRAARIGEEDRSYFFETVKPFSIKMNDFSLKVAKENLEYEEEELHQLEKMYKADDITEETEQIVLKRARDAVEKARFIVEYAKINHDETARFGLPRAEEMIKESTLRKSVDWEKKKLELPLTLQRQRLELEKLRLQRVRTEDRLKKLLADRGMMTVKSPIDGIVYYGKCTRGRFGDSNGMAESLRRNGIIQPNQVVMTVVAPRPMFIRASVSEDELHDVHPGMTGKVTPSGYPEPKLNATLDDVSDVPVSPGNFDAKLSVKLGRKSKFLMPGMTCKIKLTPYVKKDALGVPPKTVQTDELDDEKHFVWVLEKDGKPKKRDVELGKKTDKLTEIVKGLAEGDKVLLEPPKEEKAK